MTTTNAVIVMLLELQALLIAWALHSALFDKS